MSQPAPYDPHTDPLAQFDPLADADDYQPQPQEQPQGKRKGFWQAPRKTEDLEQGLHDVITYGDPEKGGGKPKRKKPVDHNKRSREYIEKAGYRANRLEKWQTLGSGFSCKIDYLGLWDFEGLKDGQPRLLVQVCGKTGKSAHLREMTSTKIAFDNKRPKIDNLRYCLAQGWRCYLLIWTAGANGRYSAELIKITSALVAECVARKRL